MDHPPLTSRHVTTSTCSNLRHKGMYVYDEFSPENAEAEDISATAYWCGCTQKPFGPDGEPVNKKDCAVGRSCCDR
jgi:hypothetical protein